MTSHEFSFYILGIADYEQFHAFGSLEPFELSCMEVNDNQVRLAYYHEGERLEGELFSLEQFENITELFEGIKNFVTDFNDSSWSYYERKINEEAERIETIEEKATPNYHR